MRALSPPPEARCGLWALLAAAQRAKLFKHSACGKWRQRITAFSWLLPVLVQAWGALQPASFPAFGLFGACSGSATTDAARDFTVTVDAADLRPGTRYWYRFSSGKLHRWACPACSPKRVVAAKRCKQRVNPKSFNISYCALQRGGGDQNGSGGSSRGPDLRRRVLLQLGLRLLPPLPRPLQGGRPRLCGALWG